MQPRRDVVRNSDLPRSTAVPLDDGNEENLIKYLKNLNRNLGGIIYISSHSTTIAVIFNQGKEDNITNRWDYRDNERETLEEGESLMDKRNCDFENFFKSIKKEELALSYR